MAQDGMRSVAPPRDDRSETLSSEDLLDDLERILKSKIVVTGRRKLMVGKGVKEAVELMVTATGRPKSVNSWATEFGKSGLELHWNQLDLLVAERADFLAVDGNRADQLVVFEHRDADKRTRASELGNS